MGKDGSFEQMERQLLGPVLYEIAERKNYDSAAVGGGACLLWGRAEAENPAALERLFPTPECFELRTGHSFPRVPWISSHFRKREDWDNHLQAHQKLKTEFAKERKVPVQKVPVLTAWRDGIEKQLRRIHAQLLEPLGVLRDILKVWYMEALDHVSLPTEEFELLSSKEKQRRYELFLRLKANTKKIWDGISEGAPTPMIEGWLPKKTPIPGLPKKLDEAQRAGVLHYLPQRDSLIEDALPLHCQWWALEVLLQRVLVREPVLSDEEIKKHLQDEHELKKVYEGGAPAYWRRAYELYYNQAELNTWEEVYNYMCEEQQRLGYVGLRHKDSQTFESARTNFQSKNGKPRV